LRYGYGFTADLVLTRFEVCRYLGKTSKGEVKMTMLAYPGGEAQKAAIIAELQEHADHDRLVKGQYWQNGKGCAVGCTIRSGNHVEYESRFGIPVMLAQLEDSIFEGLPNEEAIKWPIQFMSMIPVSADLSLVGWKFLDRMLQRLFARIDASSRVHIDCASALDIVAKKAMGESVTAADVNYAASAANAAASAANAAYAGANSAYAVNSAAYAAANSASSANAAASAANSAYAVNAAAYAAANSAAYAAANSASSANAAYAGVASERVAQAKDLLELLAAAPAN
jgi:hypothetical protein